MKKALDGIFTMLRNIHREQKKQTKMLQAIESSMEQEEISYAYKKDRVQDSDGNTYNSIDESMMNPN